MYEIVKLFAFKQNEVDSHIQERVALMSEFSEYFIQLFDGFKE